MKKSVKRAVWIVVALLLIFFVINMFRYLNKKHTYAIATKTTVEQSFSSEGILIRNEKTIPVSGGVFETAVASGTRVSGKSLLGYLYKGVLDSETEQKLQELNNRINQLSDDMLFSSSYRSSAPAELALKNAYKMMEAVNAGNYQDAGSYADNIRFALDQQSVGDGSDNLESQLNQLRTEKSDLESRISAVRENVYAPFGGIFSETVDGYESVFSVEQLRTLLPGQLKETNPVKESGNAIKVMDNSQWYFATTVSSHIAQDLKVGMNVTLRFPELSETEAGATVYALNTDGDEACLVLSCSRTIPGIFEIRHVSAEVVITSNSGYQLPSEALRMKEDQQGVYVVRDNLARFVPVDIVQQGEDYILVSTMTTDGIKLYDEVILSGHVEEGMLVQ